MNVFSQLYSYSLCQHCSFYLSFSHKCITIQNTTVFNCSTRECEGFQKFHATLPSFTQCLIKHGVTVLLKRNRSKTVHKERERAERRMQKLCTNPENHLRTDFYSHQEASEFGKSNDKAQLILLFQFISILPSDKLLLSDLWSFHTMHSKTKCFPNSVQL